MNRRGPLDGDARLLAEAVRHACLEAAREAFDSASLSGLCREGAEEAALDAIRALDLKRVLQLPSAASEKI